MTISKVTMQQNVTNQQQSADAENQRISTTGKSIEVYVYDGNIITATVNRRLKFNDDRTISFKLNNNHEFHIGNWEEFN